VTTTLIQFIRFLLVGATGVLIDFAITFIFKEILKFNRFIANALGFIVAATSNYLLNRIWTFENHNPDILPQYLRFFAISLVGLGINTLVIYMINDILKIKFHRFVRCSDNSKIDFYSAKLIAIGVVTLWNFIMNSLFTF